MEQNCSNNDKSSTKDDDVKAKSNELVPKIPEARPSDEVRIDLAKIRPMSIDENYVSIMQTYSKEQTKLEPIKIPIQPLEIITTPLERKLSMEGSPSVENIPSVENTLFMDTKYNGVQPPPPSPPPSPSSPTGNVTKVEENNLDEKAKAEKELKQWEKLSKEKFPVPSMRRICSTMSSSDTQSNTRRLFVKEMVHKAWHGAMQARNDNSILSLKHSSHISFKDRSLVSQDSLVNAMSTFIVVGMETEFKSAQRWIETKLELNNIDKELDVTRLVSNYIGSLLSCFALTWDRIFLDKAEQLANKLDAAYRSVTGLPYQQINLSTGQAGGSLVWLSEVSNGMLEYCYLSDVTDDPKYRQRCDVARAFLKQHSKSNGLYMLRLDVDTGLWASTSSTLSFAASQFYQSLLDRFIYSGYEDVTSFQMFIDAMDAIQKNGLFGTSLKAKMIYARDYDSTTGHYDEFMSHYSSYLGGMFALAAFAIQHRMPNDDEHLQMYRKLADDLTETCHIASDRTATKLIPTRFYFDEKDEATNSRMYDREHILSPELAKTYFIMWRLTKQQKYREYAWELAQAIDRNCLNEKGYWDIADVEQVPSKKFDYHDSHFIGGTLKFLYLTFCDDCVLPLNMWVFNGSGNPLPITAHDKGLQTMQ
ncbi:hypothetical protein BLOT_016093 [Blomia tropicalis]|nr:hypothetical protein BLOT_016093 [Blomia tropicalis]